MRKPTTRHLIQVPFAYAARPLLLSLSFSISVFLFFILPACTPKTADATLDIQPPERFTYNGEVEMPEKWWKNFNDPRLNALIDTAIEDNFELLAAWSRLRAAEAVVRREGSRLLPDVEASAQTGISRPEPDFVGGENVRFGISAFYEVDLWGRIRSATQAERYRAEATIFDYRATSLIITAEIVRTWFQLQAAWDQLNLANEQVENNEKILRLIVNRFRSGQVRGVDILRQKQLVESTRELKVQAESRIQVLEHQLAVLLGHPAQLPIDYVPDTVPPLPPLPETGLPLELVERRPDVQRAFSLLKAADRDMASAISAKYPRITLSTSLSARSNNWENLFQNWAYALGGNILAPLFYGGRLSAEVDRTEAVKDQRLYEYGQSVLVAFREVEDALVQEKKQEERIDILREQIKLANQAYEQLQIEYINGFSNYLAVLTALNAEQQLRRDLIAAKLAKIEFRVNLYRALAGGFETPREQNRS